LPKRAAQVRWVFPETLATAVPSGRRVVGRDEDCDTRLDGQEISRRHAELRADGPMLAIRDLDSRNGVHVNGKRVSDAPLAPGDVVRCGEWVGVAVADEEPPGLTEIAPGWLGGPALVAATRPARAAGDALSIVVQGETGTGKEGLARAVHAWSGRTGPFVAVNCAALPSHLAEAELFGYRRGAFTGADRSSPGFFRAAHGGTLFLDEVLELPRDVQPKLLRALEQREVQSLGEAATVHVDVRIVAAAQAPLAEAVAAGRFRADLQARLDGLTIVLPPLRARRDEAVALFRELLRQHAGGRAPALDPKLIESVALHDWPLNVRELVTVARRLLVVHGHEPLLRRAHLPDELRARAEAPTATVAGQPAPPARRSVDDAEDFATLVAALRAHEGSVSRAAAAAGLSRARAYRLLAAHPEFALDQTRQRQ
jgi:transcriptional regulator with PAS, ATPase and Fis domain